MVEERPARTGRDPRANAAERWDALAPEEEPEEASEPLHRGFWERLAALFELDPRSRHGGGL